MSQTPKTPIFSDLRFRSGEFDYVDANGVQQRNVPYALPLFRNGLALLCVKLSDPELSGDFYYVEPYGKQLVFGFGRKTVLVPDPSLADALNEFLKLPKPARFKMENNKKYFTGCSEADVDAILKIIAAQPDAELAKAPLADDLLRPTQFLDAVPICSSQSKRPPAPSERCHRLPFVPMGIINAARRISSQPR